MNHKRGRGKAQRAGCLLCKPHKLTGAPAPAVRRVLQPAEDFGGHGCEGFCHECWYAVTERVGDNLMRALGPRAYHEPMRVTLGELARAA